MAPHRNPPHLAIAYDPKTLIHICVNNIRHGQ